MTKTTPSPETVPASKSVDRWRGLRLTGLCLGVAVCVWALFTGPLLTQVELYGDGERDLFQAWAAAHTDWEPSEGPMIAGMLDVHLGAGWVRFMQLVVPWVPTSMGVYKVHVAITALAIAFLFAVLWLRVNPGAAVVSILLLILSVFLVRTLRIVWHPGLVPAMGTLWVAAVIMAVTASRKPVRGWWLLAAWITVALFMHLHLVVLPYAATLLGIQGWFWWKGGWRCAPVATSLTVVLLGVVAMNVVPIVWAMTTAPVLPNYAQGLPAMDRLTYWVAMFGSAWNEGATYGLRWNVLGVLVLGALLVGVFRAGRKDAPPLERWLALLVLLGGIMATLSLQAGSQPRYAGACGPAVCVLAGMVLASFRVPLPKASWKLPLGLVLVLGLALFDPLNWQGIQREYVREPPSLSGIEQEKSLSELMRHRDLDWDTLRTQVHGWAVTGQSHRYVALSMGVVQAPKPAVDPSHHTLVIPGQPPPAYSTKIWSFDGGAGRLLTWVQHAPRFALADVRFQTSGRSCLAELPYQNLAQPALAVLSAVGMAEPWSSKPVEKGMYPCRMQMLDDTEERLVVDLPPIEGEAPLTLLLMPARAGEDLQVRTQSGELLTAKPYAVDPYRGDGERDTPEYAAYQVAIRAGEGLQISLPKLGLTGLDIY